MDMSQVGNRTRRTVFQYLAARKDLVSSILDWESADNMSECGTDSAEHSISA